MPLRPDSPYDCELYAQSCGDSVESVLSRCTVGLSLEMVSADESIFKLDCDEVLLCTGVSSCGRGEVVDYLQDIEDYPWFIYLRTPQFTTRQKAAPLPMGRVLDRLGNCTEVPPVPVGFCRREGLAGPFAECLAFLDSLRNQLRGLYFCSCLVWNHSETLARLGCLSRDLNGGRYFPVGQLHPATTPILI